MTCSGYVLAGGASRRMGHDMAQLLCAVYHRRVAPAAESAIHRKLFTMQDFISTIRTSRRPHNVNTPSEWSAK
jgi:molybdopterin-guanine dinucleotide biosynthesis protein A